MIKAQSVYKTDLTINHEKNAYLERGRTQMDRRSTSSRSCQRGRCDASHPIDEQNRLRYITRRRPSQRKGLKSATMSAGPQPASVPTEPATK